MIIVRIIIACLALLPTAAFAAELGQARISLISGDVQIYTDDTGDWVPASINMPLREGNRIWVPEGARSEVQILGGVYVRIGSATSFDILALQEESYQFYLNGGHLYINNRRGGIDHIQIDTPRSSVGCYDNSLVLIDVAEDGATDVSVHKGHAAAETPEGKARVEAGETFHLGDRTAEISPLAPPDAWETWNRERDRTISAGNRSLRYLPEELDDYAYELDDYGKWAYVSDYGYVWQPGQVAASWSPYRDGRWTWVGGDYVWISYQPWGWVPHHYGRWAFVGSFGWCWVPPRRGEIYWSPGYVGWVNTPNHVAWVPLAPGETYYGRGYYGPRSVNITNVNINQINVVNFRNVNIRNAVTVVNRNSFITGRRERVTLRENPFRAKNVQFGPPVIKPTRAAAMPIMRRIPEAKRPPERVQRLSVPEIRRERSVVREEKGSAFRGQRPGAAMPIQRHAEPRARVREQHPALPQAQPALRKGLAPRGENHVPPQTPKGLKGRPAPTPEQPATPQRPGASAPDRTIPRPPAVPAAPPGIAPRQERAPREPRWQEPASRAPRREGGAARAPAPVSPPAGRALTPKRPVEQPAARPVPPAAPTTPRVMKPETHRPAPARPMKPVLPGEHDEPKGQERGLR